MQKLPKKEVLAIYNQCMRLIKRKSPDFCILRKIRGWQGHCDYEKDILEIDPRKEVIRTALHECVHYLYPDWSETQVIYTESRLVKTLDSFDIARFMKLLFIKIYQAELQKTLSTKRSIKNKKNKNKRVAKTQKL